MPPTLFLWGPVAVWLLLTAIAVLMVLMTVRRRRQAASATRQDASQDSDRVQRLLRKSTGWALFGGVLWAYASLLWLIAFPQSRPEYAFVPDHSVLLIVAASLICLLVGALYGSAAASTKAARSK